jgi:mediator of RNA polymerase II transcription subunit 21
VVPVANKKELATDLIVKAKQVEYLIQSLPEPEPQEQQVRLLSFCIESC